MTTAVSTGVAVAIAAIVATGVAAAVIVKKKCVKGSSSARKRFVLITSSLNLRPIMGELYDISKALHLYEIVRVLRIASDIEVTRSKNAQHGKVISCYA